MTEDITKSEISALIEAHSQTSAHLERIASSLRELADEQKIIKDILIENQKLARDYVDKALEKQEKLCTCSRTEIGDTLKSIKGDYLFPIRTNAQFMKWAMTGLMSIVVIAQLLLWLQTSSIDK